MQRAGPRSARTSRAYATGLVGVLADAEPEVQAVGLVAELERGGPTARASPCRPTPRRAPARRARSCRASSIARRTCSRQWCRKQSRQNAALWRRTSMTAGSRHAALHGTLTVGASRDDGADLDDVVVGEARVAGDELSPADHEHRLGVELEAPRAARATVIGPGDLELAARVAQQDLHRAARLPAAGPRSRGSATRLARLRARSQERRSRGSTYRARSGADRAGAT